MPKKILIFITLKVAEIGGIVFLPYWIGKIGVESFARYNNELDWLARSPLLYTWIFGFVNILFLALIIMLTYLLYSVNKYWTEIIHDKWFDK